VLGVKWDYSAAVYPAKGLERAAQERWSVRRHALENEPPLVQSPLWSVAPLESPPVARDVPLVLFAHFVTIPIY
jgi:hypothetical protein